MATEQSPNGADVQLKIAGQEVNLRNVKSLNTILTLVGAVAASFAVYLLVEHQADAKEGTMAFVQAVKEQTMVMREQTTALREQNCLISVPQDRRDPELCKRLSR